MRHQALTKVKETRFPMKVVKMILQQQTRRWRKLPWSSQLMPIKPKLVLLRRRKVWGPRAVDSKNTSRPCEIHQRASTNLASTCLRKTIRVDNAWLKKKPRSLTQYRLPRPTTRPRERKDSHQLPVSAQPVWQVKVKIRPKLRRQNQ